MDHYDVIVVGGGHAGCEAAMAAARLGKETLLLTMNLDTIAQMSCNPAIGGPAAKCHLVREIDALGGLMAQVIDRTYLNIRTLNTSRGPAVQGIRAQADKKRYHLEMTALLERRDHLHVKQGIVTDLIFDEAVQGVVTLHGKKYMAPAVVLTAGTFLCGVIVMGEVRFPGGRHGEPAAEGLSASLRRAGFELGRFQTATPPRLDRRTIDFSKLCEQPGEEGLRFSFDGTAPPREQIPCWWTRTTAETMEIIRRNIDRSPIKSGSVRGAGPRFCPSIDRKALRFPDKTDHQIFLEPEGTHTEEIYILGLTTAMPQDVQEQMVRSIPGLEEAEIMRAGYAVEYDYVIPTQLQPSLQTKVLPGLFLAGQVNGTSGYEEAAGQGIVAGINACLYLDGKSPFILDRSEAYIGVMIDDLVTKGTAEPYRMLTSRAEYRLLLRPDNADLRLREHGYRLGLVDEERYQRFLRKKDQIEKELTRLKGRQITPTAEVAKALAAVGSGTLAKPVRAFDLLKRPEVSHEDLRLIDEETPILPSEVAREVEIQVKLDGYIRRQLRQVRRFRELEEKAIPEGIDYFQVPGLRREAQERLSEIRPRSLGQASRIPGVSAADVSMLLVYLAGRGSRRRETG